MSFDIKDINRQSGLASKTINGEDYTIHLLPATAGLLMSLEISKLVMPSLGAGVDGFRHDDMLHGSPRTFSELATLLVTQMGNVSIVPMIKALLGDVEVGGKKIDFDKHFCRNYGSLMQLVEFALKENFESFFTESGLQTRFQDLMTSLTAQPVEQEGSLGS